MMYLSHKKKVLLSAAVLFALASGEAFASSYHGGTSDVTSSNETLDELYATNKAKVTVTGSGTITFTPSGTADGEGAIDASGGSVVTIGSSSLPYDRLTANGEILAEDKSTVNLYAKEITINKGDDYAAVTAANGATITIGTANTTSLTTTGEVLSTDGDNGAASSVTLTAGDVTLNYSPNPSADSGSGGDEDHTLYADGGSSLAVNASGTVTIKGPIGAVDSGSSITVDGSTISLTHNTVGEDGVTYNYDLETRGIHVEEGASVRIGSDSTTSLAIDVENSSDDSSIVVSGGASKLELYGKTISVTAEDGIHNGKLTGETFDTEYEGGSLVIGSDSTDSLIVNGPIQTVGSDASTKLLGSSIAVQSRIGTYRGGALTIGSKSTESVYVDTLFDSVNTKTTILGNDITIGNRSYYLDGMLYSSPSIDIYDGSIVTIGDDTTATVTIGGDVGADIDVQDADLTLNGGTLTASIANTFMGTTSDDSIEDLATNDLVLNLAGGATWNLTDSSTVSTLNAEGGSVSLMDGRLGETLTAGSFAGDGATLYLDADGSTNTGNDHVYVMGSHTGTTDLHLESTSNTWSGALGTVLVSVGEEQGSFVSDSETEAALYYYNLELASTSDNVTDGTAPIGTSRALRRLRQMTKGTTRRWAGTLAALREATTFFGEATWIRSSAAWAKRMGPLRTIRITGSGLGARARNSAARAIFLLTPSIMSTKWATTGSIRRRTRRSTSSVWALPTLMAMQPTCRGKGTSRAIP